jgi:chromosome segregation ATPase
VTPAPDKPMDLMQASQRIAWLDEERRRDHAELTRLAQDVAATLSAIKDQTSKIRDAGDRLNALEASLIRLPRLEDAITQTRSELPPLRDVDLRLEDTLQRQAKDHQAQADQSARQWSEINGRLEALGRAIDSLGHRITSLDTQKAEHAQRLTDLAVRIDATAKAAEALTARLQLVEAREHDVAARESTVRAQIARLETTQVQSVEEVRRSLSRVETLASEIQQIRREVIAAQQGEAERRKADVAVISEQREAIASIQRRAEQAVESTVPIVSRVEHLETYPSQISELQKRSNMLDEQVVLLQSTYKGLQAVEDKHWGADIPEIQNLVEEAHAVSQKNAATVQELVAANQALKEAVRELKLSLAAEHQYGDDLATALRGLIEEDVQTRLVMAQKQLQNIRRMANAPVEGSSTQSESETEQ